MIEYEVFKTLLSFVLVLAFFWIAFELLNLSYYVFYLLKRKNRYKDFDSPLIDLLASCRFVAVVLSIVICLVFFSIYIKSFL